MKIKKYVAENMKEAMEQIRNELGSDAIILNSKAVKTKGFLGFFRKNNIEVIAAVDASAKQPSKKRNIQEKLKMMPKQVITSPSQEKELLAEIRKLAASLHKVPMEEAPIYPEEIQGIYQFLIKQEVKKQYAVEICSAILERFYLNKKQAETSELKHWLQEELKRKLLKYPFGKVHDNKKIIYFVGPTGVGKTTTLAKMAAHSIMKEQKKIAFITMDTYRIGAIDQLKTYSKILDVPLEVAYSLEDFMEARKKFASFDTIFVDTAGRNYKQIEFIKQLKENIPLTGEEEMYLVLSATTKYKELEQIYHQFSPFSIKKMIFTKVDEISEYGPLFNMVLDCNVGIAYLTNGQNVPDDFLEAAPETISNLIVGEWDDA
jgi:flagellar biosynthesis protein FlhF